MEEKQEYIKKYSEETMRKNVFLSNILSNQMLSHFFELLGFDSDLFSHLYSVEIKLDYNSKNTSECAHYEALDFENDEQRNGIVINGIYVDETLSLHNKGVRSIEILRDIAETIIHEKLHSNRDVLLKREVNFSNIDYYSEYLKMSDKNKKTYEECNYLKNIIELNDGLTILKIRNYKSYSLIYVYDNNEKCFYIYRLNLKKFKFNNDIQAYFKEVMDYIIANEIKPINEIYDFEYFFSQNEHDINNIYESNRNIKSIREVNKIDKVINMKYGLEEALVEALTLIISYHSNKDTLDIEGACNYIQKKTSKDIVKRGIRIFKKYKEDFIKWFILSSYQDEYDNKLQKMYGKNYLRTLRKFRDIYDSNEKNETQKNEVKEVNLNEVNETNTSEVPNTNQSEESKLDTDNLDKPKIK